MAATKPAELIPADSPGLSLRTIAEMVNSIPLDRITRTIAEMLDACTPQGNPDWRARTDGAKLWLSYVIGLPVQRQEIVTHKITTAPALRSLMSDPAVRERIQAELDAAGVQSQ